MFNLPWSSCRTWTSTVSYCRGCNWWEGPTPVTMASRQMSNMMMIPLGIRATILTSLSGMGRRGSPSQPFILIRSMFPSEIQWICASEFHGHLWKKEINTTSILTLEGSTTVLSILLVDQDGRRTSQLMVSTSNYGIKFPQRETHTAPMESTNKVSIHAFHTKWCVRFASLWNSKKIQRTTLSAGSTLVAATRTTRLFGTFRPFHMKLITLKMSSSR